MPRIYNYIFCLFLLSCNTESSVTVGGVKVTSSLRKAADEHQFDYTGHLAKALSGDEFSTEKLLIFSNQLDSANAESHGRVLAALMAKLGDQHFSKITDKLASESKRTVWATIEAGGTPPLKAAAPLTLATLLPPRQIQEYRGLYVFDPKMNTFQDCSEPALKYIAIDETEAIERNYRRLLRFPYPGQPIFAEVKGYKSDFYGNKKLPAKFAGFFVVTEILELETKNYRNTCIPYEYWALGTEPFWEAQISASEGIIEFRGMDDERTKVFAYFQPVMDDSAMVYTAINQDTGDNIRIAVKEESCSDGMSDIRYDFKVELTMNGNSFSGCGISFSQAQEKEESSEEN